nr:hypothetical protein [Ilumatobacter sp.]
AEFADRRPAFGKTGTQQNNWTAFFVGATPELSTAVMVRDPDRYTPMRNVPEFEAAGVSRVQGGTFPARIWGAYMEQIGLEQFEFTDWDRPGPQPREAARLYLPGNECLFDIVGYEPAATVPPDPAAPPAAPTPFRSPHAPPATDPPATDPPATDPAAGTVVPVSLIEWEIVAPNEFTGGTVTFEASNDGEFPHELVLVRGESYETLPLLANGAVDEDAIAPDDFIGRIERFEPGQTMSATWEVPPGNYVLLCNIAVGPNSHAAAGQVLSVTVTA